VATLVGKDVSMSAMSRCLLACPRKDAKCELPFERYIAVAVLAGEEVSMSAMSRCPLPCPRKDAKCEFPFERYLARAALAGEDMSMSALSRCLLPCPRKDAKGELPCERYIAVAALAGEEVSMSAMSRCLLPCPRKDARCEFSVPMHGTRGVWAAGPGLGPLRSSPSLGRGPGSGKRIPGDRVACGRGWVRSIGSAPQGDMHFMIITPWE
jgi:hypothetical protein